MCNYSIGQELVKATPLEVLRSVAAVARGLEALPRPYLVRPRKIDLRRGDRDPDRILLSTVGRSPGRTAAPLVVQRGVRNRETADRIREGMWRVGHEDHGTAANPALDLWRFNAAYKTGTAEASDADKNLHHAWLVGFAPFPAPRIAFVVVLERTRAHGADGCAPVATCLLRHFAMKDEAAYLVDGEVLSNIPSCSGAVP
jgi:cell division protein FtsI/penicillin-binding protein 2